MGLCGHWNIPRLQKVPLPPNMLLGSPNLALLGVLEQISTWELGKSVFESRICHLLAVWPWASYFTSEYLCL